jgi:opacity protein-like surface antigen
MKSFAAACAFAAVAAAKNCQQLTIPIQASARNGVFDIAVPANNVEVTDFFLNLAQQGANYTQSVLTGVRYPT